MGQIVAHMSEVQWARLSAPELGVLAGKDAVVILPVGSIEQHGPHLPVDVDSRLVHEVSVRAAGLAPPERPVVVAPTVSVGLAQHHMSFGGTLTLDFSTFHALLRCIVESMLHCGFRKIAMVNGHGGNTNPLKVVVNELAREFDAPFVSCTYWDLADSAFREILDVQRCVMHGGEVETSLMLAVAPELVRLDRLEGIDPPSFEGDEDPFEAAFYRSLDMDELSESGVLGSPLSASVEKGERLLAAAAEALSGRLLEPDTWTRKKPAARRAGS